MCATSARSVGFDRTTRGVISTTAGKMRSEKIESFLWRVVRSPRLDCLLDTFMRFLNWEEVLPRRRLRFNLLPLYPGRSRLAGGRVALRSRRPVHSASRED